MTDYLTLDVETIPTDDPAVIVQIAESVTPPKSMSLSKTIAAWVADTKPGLITEAVAKTSFNGGYGSLCCVGWAWNDGDVQTMVDHDPDEPQGAFLSRALSHIVAGRPQPNYAPITIVGHNVSGFDIRFLWQRAFVLGVKMPGWFPRDPKPWSKEVHDTMMMWGGARDFVGLEELGRIMGLPPSTGIDGSEVAATWAEGDYEAIRDHCRQDVERVRAVHKKMLVAMGETE